MEQHRTEDRRKPWDGTERRGCYFDPATAAEAIAAHLATHQDEREEQRAKAELQERNERKLKRWEQAGRFAAKGFLYFLGSLAVYYGGHQRVVSAGLQWLFKVLESGPAG